MKTILPLIAGLSLALNGVLAVLITRSPGSSDAPVRTPETISEPANAAAKSLAGTGAAAQIDPALQASLDSGDLAGLVARLRENGFPPDVIRAMVRAELGRKFVARRQELDPGEATRPFWQNRPMDPKLNAEIANLSREHAKILRDLLGDDAQDPMAAAYLSRRLNGVPPEKADGVKRILQDYDDMRTEIYRAGLVTPADREKLTAIEKAQRADLAQLLSPDELLEYNLRSSQVADQLRSQLAAFDPSEAEFRAIYQLQAEFAERTGSLFGPLSSEQLRQRREAQKELNEQIKAVLEPGRAAEYERSQDGNYQQISRLVARLDLPADATNQVWSVQQDIQKQRQALMANRELPADERTQLIATLAEEAATRISATLGARGFEAYKQYGGQWLQQLQPGAPSDQTTATGQMLFIGR
jgi:hypothetical protein